MRLPDEVRQIVLRSEWTHAEHFRDQWLGDRQGTRIPLNPGNRLGEDPITLRNFRESWEKVQAELQGLQRETVRFEERTSRLFGTQRLPVELSLNSLESIAAFLGGDALKRLRSLQSRLRPFIECSDDWGRAAMRHVRRIEDLSESEAAMLAIALPQMHRGMGEGMFMRALPLEKVDTKFLERNASTVSYILNTWTGGEVQDVGGLDAWLGCLTKGADRIMVRPLSDATRSAFCGAAKLWVSSDDLTGMHLPGRFVLIVENDTSALALPDLEGVVCIAGTGRNLAWMERIDLGRHAAAYWGDIDSWGLGCLATAREIRPDIPALMMDQATLEAHPARVVREDKPSPMPASGLSEAERSLFVRLTADPGNPLRLEQEFLDGDWIETALRNWMRTI